MPAKSRKAAVVEDLRSPLEISIANTQEQLRQSETLVNQYREGVQDLATHTLKIKSLESEIVPKEAERKAVMQSFYKLLETNVAISRSRSASDMAEVAAVTPSMSTSVAKPIIVRGPSRPGTTSPPSAAGAVQQTLSSTSEDIIDKEALKALSAVIRESLCTIINPIFAREATTLERQIDEAKEREAHEAAAAAASPNQTTPLPKPSGPPPGSKSGAARGVPEAARVVSSEELQSRVDHELYRPPGIDPHFFADVLKLRTQRLSVERQLKNLHQQLSFSRQLVARRTAEGASKSALKKAEKNAQALQQALRDLERQREDQERNRKSEGSVAAPAARGSAAKAAAAAATAASATGSRK